MEFRAWKNLHEVKGRYGSWGNLPGWRSTGLSGIRRRGGVWLWPFLPARRITRSRSFSEQIQPILEEYCGSCHGNGMKKGGMTFDGIEADQRRLQRSAISGRRAQERPGRHHAAGRQAAAVRPGTANPRGLDQVRGVRDRPQGSRPRPRHRPPAQPGRVPQHDPRPDGCRLSTPTAEFPPDDTGHGFDNIGDVLTLSPLLLEKYLAAATSIVAQAVPTRPGSSPSRSIAGRQFPPGTDEAGQANGQGRCPSPITSPRRSRRSFEVEHAGQYQLVLDLTATERYVDGVFDYNKCRLVFKVDGEELLRQEFSRQDGKTFRFEFDRDWKAGPHELDVRAQAADAGREQVRSLAIRIKSVTVRGPLDEQYWIRPPELRAVLPRRRARESGRARGAMPASSWAGSPRRAFRRPVDDADVDRLVGAGRAASADRGADLRGRRRAGDGGRPGLAPVPLPRGGRSSRARRTGIRCIDEYALASRLSYFLWSSMPDDELFRLAGRAQAAREPAAPRSRGCSPTRGRRSSSALRRPVAPGARHRDGADQRARP